MAENKVIKETVEELFNKVGIDGGFDLNETEEEIELTLKTEDSGIVIGYHGETLEALQLVISLMLAKKTGEFKRVSIEVGDYKKNRSEWLKNLAMDTKRKVLEQGREIQLTELKSWERRVVHLILQDDQEVSTESMGEGRDRVLVVKPK